jgi:hypothetical protein
VSAGAALWWLANASIAFQFELCGSLMCQFGLSFSNTMFVSLSNNVTYLPAADGPVRHARLLLNLIFGDTLL